MWPTPPPLSSPTSLCSTDRAPRRHPTTSLASPGEDKGDASAPSPPTCPAFPHLPPPTPLSISAALSPLARARPPPKPCRRRGPDHHSSSHRVPVLLLRRPRRPRASGRAGVPCSGRVKLFPNLGRRRPPRSIPPPLCAPVHSRASMCRAVSLRTLLLPPVPPHAP